MIRRLLWLLAGRLRVVTVWAECAPDSVHRSALFERYLLARLPGGGAVYLHHYLRSDPDRGPHDHPWDWAWALPLAGGYVEERLCGFSDEGLRLRYRRRRPGVPYRLGGGDFHRVVLPARCTSWSLFAHGPKRKAWGFLRPLPAGAARAPAFRYDAASGAGDGDLVDALDDFSVRGHDVLRAAP